MCFTTFSLVSVYSPEFEVISKQQREKFSTHQNVNYYEVGSHVAFGVLPCGDTVCPNSGNVLYMSYQEIAISLHI